MRVVPDTLELAGDYPALIADRFPVFGVIQLMHVDQRVAQMNLIESLWVLYQATRDGSMIQDRLGFFFISHRNDGNELVVDKTRELMLA